MRGPLRRGARYGVRALREKAKEAGSVAGKVGNEKVNPPPLYF